MMKKYSVLVLAAAVFLASCGGSKKDADGSLNDLKAKLEKEKKDKEAKDASVKALEEQIAKLDTSAANAKAKLVAFDTVVTGSFEHFIDLQGKIDADNISYISPRMGPAQVKAVYIKEGQRVSKGQLLLKLDDAIIRQQIVAAKQQAEGIKTQLGFAKNIYQRQKNLWDQGIGTEVQLITAKTNVESLENQLKAADEQTKVAIEQLKTANVYSDVSGVADLVNIRVGETFSGMGATGPQIKIVNTSSLKAVINVPENYLTRVHQGAEVQINIPDANVSNLKANISVISQVVDPTLRGFIAEARIPFNAALKPNQTALVRIKDYAAANAVIVPVNIVQTDEAGKYVYVAVRSGNGRINASKRKVTVGEVYGEKVEIRGGLNPGEQLITEGYQNLYEGQLVTDQVK